VIQTKGKFELNDDIVFIQLLNIKEQYESEEMDFGFTVLFRPEKSRKDDGIDIYKPEFFYYVINVNHEVIYKLLDRFNIQCFNIKKKILCEFHYEEHEDFEFPSDLQVQSLLMHAFNEEFDIEKFVLEGLIVSHFPLENTKKIHQLESIWVEEGFNCIKDSISTSTTFSSLKPLNAFNLYFGPVLGYHFGLIVHIIGWLVFPSIVGIGFEITIIMTGNFDNKYVPLYAVFMACWATIFMESWKRRESELTFIWDMYKFK
jgi:anoctamin-10